jgi:hypothetical protein
MDMAARRYRSHHPHLPASVVPVLFQSVWSDWMGELDSVCNHTENLQLPFKELSLKTPLFDNNTVIGKLGV